jgi:hypothetical protein
LTALVGRAGEIVANADLIARVWPGKRQMVSAEARSLFVSSSEAALPPLEGKMKWFRQKERRDDRYQPVLRPAG